MHSSIKLTPLVETIQLIKMSDEEYFSQKWANCVSNSKLTLINPEQGGNPEMYKEGLGKHSKVSNSLTLGSAVHEMVLQPKDFIIATEVDRPTAKMGAMADALYNVFIERTVNDADVIDASNKVDYYKGKMDTVKITNVIDKCLGYWQSRSIWEKNISNVQPIFLDPKSREKLHLCLNSVYNNKEIQSLLHPEGIFSDPISMNEAALFMSVRAESGTKETILKLKAKLDNFTIDVDTGDVVLNDLKTTGHWLIDFPDSFIKYHYARQMAMYSWMLRLYTEAKFHSKPENLTANMLLVSTVPDYRAGIYKVTTASIRKGFLELKDLLQRVAYLQLYDC